MELPAVDWNLIATHLVKLGIAYLLAVPIGWDREGAARGAGLRTFPLVAVASCGYLLIGMEILEGSPSHARLLYGLMTGMGFIGGGAILKQEGVVTGTATAASIWNTGAIGAAVAWQRLEIALVLSAINFATLRFVPPLKALAHERERPARPPANDGGSD